MPLSTEQIQRIAGLEVNALRSAEVLGEKSERSRVITRCENLATHTYAYSSVPSHV